MHIVCFKCSVSWRHLDINSEEMIVVYWLSSKKMDTVTRVQILDEAVFISHCPNSLGKCVNPTSLSLSLSLSLFLSCFARWIRLHNFPVGVKPLRRGLSFSAVFTSSCLVSNCHVYIVAFRSQLTLFLFSIPLPLSKRLFCLIPFQPIRTRCRFDADPFLFLTRAFLVILLYEDIQSFFFSSKCSQ